MSATMLGIEVVFTIRDSQFLPRTPEGDLMDPFEVGDDLRQALQAAISEWYEAGGKSLLVCPPDVI